MLDALGFQAAAVRGVVEPDPSDDTATRFAHLFDRRPGAPDMTRPVTWPTVTLAAPITEPTQRGPLEGKVVVTPGGPLPPSVHRR